MGSLRGIEVSSLEKERVLKASNGIPLAVEWFVGQLSLGFSIDKLISQLVENNRDDTKDLLRILFDEAINKIKDRHSYKILISLALLGGSGNRQSINFITGLSDTDSDEGLIELIDFSLVSREGTNFILSPLTRDYVEGFLKEVSLSSNNKSIVDWARVLSQTDINQQRELVDEKFDIFLAHNSSEKVSVQKIANELRRRKIKPWVDVEQIRPGALFQSSITSAINNVKTVAVIIGNSGVGNFQSLEIKTFISRAVNAGIPIIPILLPGTASIKDENLLFLMEFQWISFQNLDDGTAYDLLEWGITGKKPKSLLIFDE